MKSEVVCECVFESKREREIVCVFMCECVSERLCVWGERERGREREKEKSGTGVRILTTFD